MTKNVRKLNKLSDANRLLAFKYHDTDQEVTSQCVVYNLLSKDVLAR